MDGHRNEHRLMSAKTVPCTALALVILAPGLPARADDAATLTEPAKTIEVGAEYTSADSFKFGEYNGLQEQGTHAIGNVDLADGDRYDSASAKRWTIQAENLGLSTADAAIEYRDQGRYRIGVSYEGIRQNTSDTFNTFYLGAGTNSLTLPTGWIKPVVPQLNATALNERALSPVRPTPRAAHT